MLDCCRPLEDVKQAGITLTHAACLSRCNGARVDLHRYGTFTLDELRQQVRGKVKYEAIYVQPKILTCSFYGIVSS
jgi:hypothetical protein